MKKETHSTKKSRNMTTKSIPKSMQNLLSAIEDFIVQIVEQDEESIRAVRQGFDARKSELLKLLNNNISTQKTKNVKRLKDINAPKRGKSSYIFFCLEKRTEIKDKNPDMSATDIIKELGRVWREDVSDKDKSKYEKLSNKDKTRYEEEMKDYTPPPNISTVVKTKRNGPKRSLTAYIFFCKKTRDIMKDEDHKLSPNEVTSELGKRWAALSDKNRIPFFKLAEKDMIRYKNEKKSFVDTNVSDTPNTKKVTKVIKTTTSSKKTSRKTGFSLFSKEERSVLKDENSDWNSQQITKELSRLWKELSSEEKDDYNDRSSFSEEKVSVNSVNSESELDELESE